MKKTIIVCLILALFIMSGCSGQGVKSSLNAKRMEQQPSSVPSPNTEPAGEQSSASMSAEVSGKTRVSRTSAAPMEQDIQSLESVEKEDYSSFDTIDSDLGELENIEI